MFSLKKVFRDFLYETYKRIFIFVVMTGINWPSRLRRNIQPTAAISATQLGVLATDATYYLSCWMTTAQIQQMSSTKVLFNELRN